MAEKLRVAIFMRASTNKQTTQGKKKLISRSGKASARTVSDDENDLPLQKRKCTEYIESKPDWLFTGLEYVEAGVSGFHTHSSKRTGLNRAFEDAKKGLFDILVVYKLDRIGRRSTESLNHAIKFLRYCRIWVVDKDREFTNNGDADEILNFIEFWSAKKSSLDTKVRVSDMMKLIHKEGYWTGGNPPYGYRNHPELSNMLQIEPKEAEVVKEIYRLYTSEGFGMLKIAGILNERGLKTKTGREWKTESVRRILRNTIYKGYLSYGKTKTVEGEFGSYQAYTKEGEELVSDRYWPEYEIVPAEVWEKAQKIKKSRSNMVSNWGRKVPSRKGTGKGLLVGILTCECGSNMTYGSQRDWLDSKRTKRGELYGIYRCLKRLKAGVKACGAKRGTHRAEKIESLVVDKVKDYLKELISSNMLVEIQKQTMNASKEIEEKLNQAKQDLEQWQRAKENANNHLLKILMGEESPFSEAQLKELYERAVKEVKNAERLVEEMKALKDANGLSEIDLLKLQDLLADWGELFNKATHEEKRQMLASIIDQVKVYAETIEVAINFDVVKFFEAVSCAKEIVASLENAAKDHESSIPQNIDGRGPYCCRCGDNCP
ncbi:recombinase family protein [Paenactinomyces guangxiensis]|uniref:Recombinase family protein n=1 Tax=Paenactinomyces guangxiensis TaxID=1490290 RepID=A0A7W1WNE4_9BACL|nr:recombinase family protein [Paenactinomyces guangxiensis]MBA4493118.1 recombinase family protein [Paenactinomyces guangxiensis]MBH8590032.1 recombinase family protein [Paenactinomyces guangxiensis]